MSQTKSISLTPSTTLQVTIFGAPSSTSPTILFLHFWGGSSRTFTTLSTHLSPHYHCIAPSFRGWGLSTGPQDPTTYSIQHLAADIETLISLLSIGDFILVGHSMGGKVAQLIAGRGRVTGLQGVVLIAPAPPTPLELPAEMKAQQIAAYTSRESAEFVTRNVLSGSELDEEVVGGLVDDMMLGTEFARRAWPEYVMGEEIVEVARRIDVPVLVIAGEQDKVETVERIRSEVLGNVKGAEMVVVKGSGHLIPVEASLEVSRLIEDFVRSVMIRS